jgi:hypothetical protein
VAGLGNVEIYGGLEMGGSPRGELPPITPAKLIDGTKADRRSPLGGSNTSWVSKLPDEVMANDRPAPAVSTLERADAVGRSYGCEGGPRGARVSVIILPIRVDQLDFHVTGLAPHWVGRASLGASKTARVMN